MKKEFYVISFESTHYAIMVEKKLKNKYKVNTIPTPREISASCGLSIMFEDESLEDIKEELVRQNLKKDRIDIYKVIRLNSEKKAERISWG